jgi:hypothetical protein
MIFNSIVMAVAAMLLHSASISASGVVERRDQDFSWNISSLEGYPIIDFDTDTLDSEIVFMYSFTGTANNNKYLEPKLYLADCVTEGTPGALTFDNSTAGNVLTLNVDVVQALIDPSAYYTPAADELSANITFCVRVDYMYTPLGSSVSESVNFHETKVTIAVDLTAGFNLTSINVERTGADQEEADAELDYPVIAYYCNDGNQELATAPIYNQGDVLQVCIRIDDALADEDIFVEDIVTFILSQGGNPALAAAPTTAIQNRQTDPLTLKDCDSVGDGRCNVKHQLTSKFFDDPSPGDLEVNGIALIGFGTPTGAARKLIRVPVRGLLRAAAAGEATARHLQQEPPAGGTESEFDLSFQLNPTTVPAAAEDDNNNQSSNSNTIVIIVAVVVVIICVALAVMVCVFFFYYRRNDKERGERREEQPPQIRRSGGGSGDGKSTRSLQKTSSGGSVESGSN